jgi:hypothetical protein
MRPRAVAGSIIALLAIHAGTSLAAAQVAPAVPSKVGVAAGTLEAGGHKIVLAHAYALAESSESDPTYQVLLTDGAIAPEMLEKELARGGQALLKSGKLSGLALRVDAEGFVRTMVPYVGEMRGSTMLGSAGRLTTFAAQGKAVTGQASGTENVSGREWAYSASFNAGLVAAK